MDTQKKVVAQVAMSTFHEHELLTTWRRARSENVRAAIEAKNELQGQRIEAELLEWIATGMK
jgi:hypothetical protein